MRPFFVVLLIVLAAGAAQASPQTVLDACHADARRLPADVAATTQYLSIDPIPADEREAFLRVLSYHVNSLSRESEIYPPRVVSANTLAVNRLHYRWDAKLFDRLADIDPYWHNDVVFEDYGHWQGKEWIHARWQVKTKYGNLDPVKLTELANLTGSKAPILDARWFLVQTARQIDLRSRDNKTGYYSFLGITKRADIEKIAKFKEADSIDIGREIRAAVDRSGVALQNRQIVRLQALTGAFWVTLDVVDGTGKGNALDNLERGTLKHDAEEIYFTLPNSLFGYFAGNAQGVAQNTVPDTIAANDSPLREGRDIRIHPGPISCGQCHDSQNGLKGIDDWARKALRPPLGLKSTDYRKTLELQRQYFSDLDGALEADRAVYVRAVKKCNGWTPQENARQYSRVFNSYAFSDWGRAEFASQSGIGEERLLRSLRKYAAAAEIDARLTPLPAALAGLIQTPPIATRAEKAEESWPLLLLILAGY